MAMVMAKLMRDAMMCDGRTDMMIRLGITHEVVRTWMLRNVWGNLIFSSTYISTYIHTWVLGCAQLTSASSNHKPNATLLGPASIKSWHG